MCFSLNGPICRWLQNATFCIMWRSDHCCDWLTPDFFLVSSLWQMPPQLTCSWIFPSSFLTMHFLCSSPTLVTCLKSQPSRQQNTQQGARRMPLDNTCQNIPRTHTRLKSPFSFLYTTFVRETGGDGESLRAWALHSEGSTKFLAGVFYITQLGST